MGCFVFIFLVICILKYCGCIAPSRKAAISKCVMNLTIKNFAFEECSIKYEQTSCPICMDDFTPDSNISVIDSCNHVFHKSCLFLWLEKGQANSQLLCPYCRVVIAVYFE